MHGRLDGKRVVITAANEFLGPAATELFREEGADVLADMRDLTKVEAADELIREAGHVDVLVANLAVQNPRTLAHETTHAQWA